MNVLNEVRCIELAIHLWTARKKLRPEDLKNLTVNDIPPEKLASLGSKLICSPKDIAIFATLKKRAVRSCETVGARFLGGYAVPKDKLDALCTELKNIQDEFDTAKAKFLANYQNIIDQWLKENDDWKHIIRRALTPVDEVTKKLDFDYRVFCVSEHVPDDHSNQSAINDGLTSHVGSLSDTIFKEVAQEANSTWDKSFRGKDILTRNIFRPIKTLRDKLDGLSFVDPRIAPIVAKIDDCLISMPKAGPIQGTDFTALEALIFTMANSDKMKQHGQAVIDATNGVTDDAVIHVSSETTTFDVIAEVDDAPENDDEEVAISQPVMPAEKKVNEVSFF